MTERERIIELMKKTVVGMENGHKVLAETIWLPSVFETMADTLFSNGVIVPPCKVGDKVFIPDNFGRIEAEIEIIEITEREVRYGWVKYDRGVDETEVWDNGDFSVSDIGKTVFLTFEEYEKAFAERRGNDCT